MVSEPKVYIWCVILDFMHMGFNFMFDILFLHSKCWKMWIKSWKRYVCKKCFGCMNEEWVFEQNLGLMYHRGGHGFGNFFWLVFVFYFKSHTHTLKLESKGLVTFVFLVWKITKKIQILKLCSWFCSWCSWFCFWWKWFYFMFINCFMVLDDILMKEKFCPS